MDQAETLRGALTNLAAHKLRTALTMLGMIFGVGAVNDSLSALPSNVPLTSMAPCGPVSVPLARSPSTLPSNTTSPSSPVNRSSWCSTCVTTRPRPAR